MAYEVIARKWRPQSFLDLVGQEHISRTLLNALRSKRLPHGVLFTGPRGTGKTSTARILAKSLRCQKAKDFVPCQACPDCVDISLGRSIDVIEIDGASHNGVDSVRELREGVGHMPSTGTYKVYIIDEVHMLSTSAFNALLKTLEEPPPHVVFCLATTEAQKIPLTILSRLQRFDFRRIPLKQVYEHLANICKTENVKFESDALWLIARLGDGSMRDSQSLLDQMITLSSQDITTDVVVKALGLSDRSLLWNLMESLIARDSRKMLGCIDQIASSGLDPRLLVEELLEQIRNLLRVKLAQNLKQNSSDMELAESERTQLEKLSSQVTPEDLHMLFDMALKGHQDLSRSADPRLVLEMVLLRMAAAPQLVDIFKAAPAQNSPSTSPTEVTANSAHASGRHSGPSSGQPFGATSARGHSNSQAGSNSASNNSASSSTASANSSNSPNSSSAAGSNSSHNSSNQFSGRPSAPPPPMNSAQQSWDQFVKSLKQANPIFGSKLEPSFLKERSGNRITVGYPAQMKFLYDQVSTPDGVKKIQNFLQTFWGSSFEVNLSLDERAPTNSSQTEKKEDAQAQVRARLEQHPLVKATKTIFNGEIQSVKEKNQ